MKRLVILGAGTAGTMVANRLVHVLDPHEWRITIVDQDEIHYYQPGFLFIPFGTYGKADVMRPKRDYLPRAVEVIISPIEAIEPDAKRVVLAKDQRSLSYDYLIIATGCRIVPEETPGLLEDEWRKTIFDFYTPDGAVALHNFLRTWQGGRLVLNVAEMPIKCPVAPLEFLFLADAFFQDRGMRDKVELVYATPLSGAFTKPIASQQLGALLEEKNIKLITDFNIAQVNPDKQTIASYDETTVEFDLLVSVPTNMGSAVIERSGIGDDLHFVPTEKHTLKAKGFDDVFVLGDATNLTSSKAGSVAHFQVDGFVENFLRYVDGLELLPNFDGHANCFIESGHGKGFLIDFNYDVEPLPGMFPMPGLGPFSLLKQSRINHWGKVMFRWTYWNVLLKGKELPIPGADEHGREMALGQEETMSTLVIDAVVDPATGAPRGDQLAEISRKLDLLAQNMLVLGQQVNFLMEQADNNRRRLQSVDDLLADLTPVVKDVYAAAEEQLEEMQQFVTLEDVTALAKRLARNTRNFNELLDTLESAQDFVRDAAPLTKEMMTEATDVLTQLERKGYFDFMRQGVYVVDQVVTSFSAEDVKQLGDNVVLILNTVKALTQPEMMNLINGLTQGFHAADAQAEAGQLDPSLFGLMRQLRDPEVRRGLAITLETLRQVSRQAPARRPA